MINLEFKIRKSTRSDYKRILELINELALYEKAPHKVTNSVFQMEDEDYLFQCFVAELNDGTIVGIALCFFAYYTWVGKSLYLDDIIVTEQYRGHGIGKALMNQVIKFGKESKCKRIRWQVLNWNTTALDFYEKLGATIDDEWVNCDL